MILIAYRLADQLGQDSRILITLAAGLFILPFFLFSAFAGQLADKFNKIILIRWIKLAEIAIMGLGIFGLCYEKTYFLLFVLFLMGMQSAFFGPIKYSILPQLLKEEELTSGNALVSSSTFLAILFGTIIGGNFYPFSFRNFFIFLCSLSSWLLWVF